MSKIHYVWWGQPATPEHMANAINTPNIMYEAVQGTHEVHYWYGGAAGPPGGLKAGIQTHQVDPISILDGTMLSAGNGIRLKNVLNGLATYKAFAAAKDLVSFTVLYVQGGFFFDTTTQIGYGYRDHLKRLLLGTREPHAPYSEGKKVIYPGDESEEYVSSFAAGAMPAKAGSATVPNFDVWAMYAPTEHHEVFASAVNTYLNRAQNVGMDNPNKKILGGKKSIDTVMKQDDKNARNNIISGLSTTSLAEALYTYTRKKGVDIRTCGWEIRRLNAVVPVENNPAKNIQVHRPVAPQDPFMAKSNPKDISSPKLEEKKKEDKKDDKKEETKAEEYRRKMFKGMETASATLPEIGIQKRFAGSWR